MKLEKSDVADVSNINVLMSSLKANLCVGRVEETQIMFVNMVLR